MSNCMSLIAKPVSYAEIAEWRCVSDMMGVIDTQVISNICLLGGEYKADPIYFPLIDCRSIQAMVFHECTDNPDDDQILGELREIGDGTFTVADNQLCYEMCGWTIPCETCDELDEEPIVSLPDICANPCERAVILENALAQLLMGKNMVSGSYGQRSWTFTAGNKACLERWLREAQAACNACKGIRGNPRHYRWRCW